MKCVCVCVCVYPTVSDKCPASQHSSQHELGHSQQSTCEPAHYRHTEEEVVLNRDKPEKEKEHFICTSSYGKSCLLDDIKVEKDKDKAGRKQHPISVKH